MLILSCNSLQEETSKVKAAGKAWYKTMISDSDYTEFENFTKWLGVTQWLSGGSLSCQKLWFCLLLPTVACHWYLQAWYLVLAFVVFLTDDLFLPDTYYTYYENEVYAIFSTPPCFCLWLYWLHEFAWSAMSSLGHKAYLIAMYYTMHCSVPFGFLGTI